MKTMGFSKPKCLWNFKVNPYNDGVFSEVTRKLVSDGDSSSSFHRFFHVGEHIRET